MTLTLPDGIDASQTVELVDPEGLPLARVTSDGGVLPLTHAQFGPFRRLYLTPAGSATQYAGRVVRAGHRAADRRRSSPRLAGEERAGAAGARRAPARPRGSAPSGWCAPPWPPPAACSDAAVVAVPLAAHGDADADHELGVQVVRNYAGTRPGGRAGRATRTATCPTEVADIVDADRPAAGAQGLVLFFTGLSGSGKSTLARALHGPDPRAGRPHGHQPRRRRRTPEPVRGPDLLQGGPRDQHPPDRLGGRRDQPARRSRRSARPIAPFDATRRQVRHAWSTRPAAVLPGPRRHAARGVRAPRPQGPLRQGPRRRDPRVHRHLLALRGARGRRRPGRHHRSVDRGLRRRRCLDGARAGGLAPR